MRTTTRAPLSHRDRALLRAVAAGRCRRCAGPGAPVLVDGIALADQFAPARLAEAGLVAVPAAGQPLALTAAGRALLAAA